MKDASPNGATTRSSVLVVDDDLDMASLVCDVARDAGHDARSLTDPTAVIAALESGAAPDLVVTDVRMPGMDGVDLIAEVHDFDPRIVIIAMTAFGSIDTAVRAVRAGASDYLTKPFLPKDLALRIEGALERRAMRLELSRLRSEVASRFSIDGLIGRSRAIEEISSLVRRVASGPATVLVTGPSGAGKEVIARALHGSGRRAGKPFVAVNCAAIPDALLESELFGVRRGAFTDARADRPGLVLEADGGTLFLDEIGELALPLQAKLLRVLNEREVRAVGGTESVLVDVRVVAATNRDLREAVRAQAFREDLFYRLAVIEIAVPPLRDRREDILPLAEHFLTKLSSRTGGAALRLSGAASKRLLAHDWPGNVRELENALERAAALADGDVIAPDDLPAALRTPPRTDFLEDAADRGLTLDEVSRAYARIVLDRASGNKHRAAGLLGVDRRTLQRWFAEGGPKPGRPDDGRSDDE